jgi:uncharacterized lipoprotein YmbA
MILSLLVVGCGRPLGGTPTPSRFYVLTPVAATKPAESVGTGERAPIIGVTLVELPDHLKREEIVTRPTENRVTLGDLDRWAGQLGDNISTVLAQNLSIMIPSERVVVLPSSRSVPLSHRVHVDISTFEQGPSGNVQLTAVWQVFRGNGVQLLSMRRVDISTPLSGSGYDAIVAAMSQALADFSRQIADGVR